MCFLYILPWLHKNAFKRVLQGFDRIGFGSGCVWRWLDASAAVPGLLSGYPRQAVLLAFYLALVRQIMPGGGASMGSRWQSVSDRLAVPGMGPGWGENTKKMYDKSETESKPGRFEPEKSEKKSQKSETNSDLRLFYFVHSAHNFL